MKRLSTKIRHSFTGNKEIDLAGIPEKDRKKAEEFWKIEYVRRLLKEAHEPGKQIDIS